jgi:hypothetical protein
MLDMRLRISDLSTQCWTCIYVSQIYQHNIGYVSTYLKFMSISLDIISNVSDDGVRVLKHLLTSEHYPWPSFLM